jgi:sarcosine oxidase
MVRRTDVVVVGAGVMGLAAARELAGRGRDVVVLERFERGHVRGSSHGASRVFRCSYTDPEYVGMALEAIPLWRDLEAESGAALLDLSGGLDVAPVAGLLEAIGDQGVAHAVLDGGGAGARWPAYRLEPDEVVVWQPDTVGRVDAERTVAALHESAVRRGAEVEHGTPVNELREAAGGIEVRSPLGTVLARAVVVAAGAWSKGLLAPLGIDLPVRVTRETPMYFPLREGSDGGWPVFVEWLTPLVYALPTPGLGVKSGEHKGGHEVDPERPGGPDLEAVSRVSRWVADRVPGVEPEPHVVETCLYTRTVDDRFVLERRGPVVVGSACSGHGFKFGPLIGRRLADLATDALAAPA